MSPHYEPPTDDEIRDGAERIVSGSPPRLDDAPASELTPSEGRAHQAVPYKKTLAYRVRFWLEVATIVIVVVGVVRFVLWGGGW